MSTPQDFYKELDAATEIILILECIPEHRQVAVLAMVPLFMDSDNYQVYKDGDNE
jgi:hypothetical protein